MTVAIKVENLSKKYIISHEKKTASYETFSGSLIQTGRNIGNRIINPFRRSETALGKEEFWALKDINFEINQGDKVGIIGRNGAGKSTLLKILSRITEPTSGKIHINGRIASLLEVGTGFHPELTGRENIYLNGAILGMSRQEVKLKFDEIVDFSEVEKFLDTPVKRYSSGMYMRLAFAVAAHLESEILVIDEVLAVGDAAFQKKCLGKMDDVSKVGRTVLFVSHNLTHIGKICSKAVYLEGGEVICSSSLNVAISKYIERDINGFEMAFKPLVDGAVRLQSVSVLSKDTKGVFLSTFNKELVIDVEFNLRLELNCVSFHLGIDTLLGVRVTTIDSKFNCFELEQLMPGVYKLNISLKDMKLMPGRYSISKFMIRDQSGEKACFLNNMVAFDVSDDLYQAPVGTGIILGEANWSLLK